MTPASDHPPSPAAPESPPEPLHRCVRDAVDCYLRNMDGHAIADLYALVLAEVERPLFAAILEHTAGNLSAAARILGLTRGTLRQRLRDHGIARPR